MGSGSCSTLVTTTLLLEESELISLGTVSLTDTSVCIGTIPGNIVSTASPTATISGTSFAYRWQQRANTATSTWVDIPNPRGDKETLTFSGSPLTESTLLEEILHILPMVKPVQRLAPNKQSRLRIHLY